MKLLGPTLESVPVARPIPSEEGPQGLCLDKGYDYDAVRELVLAHRFVPHVRGQVELDAIAAELNGRPREILGWATPAEKMEELLR